VVLGLPHRSDLPPFIGADILFVPVAIAGYGLRSLWIEARLRRDARRMRRHGSCAH
jgi:hypothetical protein